MDGNGLFHCVTRRDLRTGLDVGIQVSDNHECGEKEYTAVVFLGSFTKGTPVGYSLFIQVNQTQEGLETSVIEGDDAVLVDVTFDRRGVVAVEDGGYDLNFRFHQRSTELCFEFVPGFEITLTR